MGRDLANLAVLAAVGDHLSFRVGEDDDGDDPQGFSPSARKVFQRVKCAEAAGPPAASTKIGYALLIAFSGGAATAARP
jgi:hypothetical protein